MSAGRDLRAAGLGAACLAVAALIVPVGWLSLLLLAPLAFFLTGYAVAAASFVATPQPWPRAFFVSVALSLAVLALLPLPLNYLGGLTPGGWAAALAIVVLVGCGIAARRRPPDWTDPAIGSMRLPRPTPVAALLGLAAVAIVAGALVLAHVPLSNGKVEGFSQLWMRPVAGAGGAAVRVGVGNQEQRRTAYLVRVSFQGGQEVTRSLVLASGESSAFEVTAAPQPRPGRPIFATVLLFRRADPVHPYRRVYGWVSARAPE